MTPLRPRGKRITCSESNLYGQATFRIASYYDSDGIVDIVGTPTSALRYGPGAIITGSPETASFSGDSFNGLTLQQQNAVFDVNGAPVVRSILFVTNTTGSTITQNIGALNNLGSDSNTRIFATSSGDTTFTPGTDTWVGSFQNYSGTTSSDPRLVFQLQGAFGHIDQGLNSSSSYVTGNDRPHFNFTATLAAGETKAFMVFNGLYASKAAGIANNSAFTSFGALQSHGLLAGLSSAQLKQIQNWDLSGAPDVGVAVAANDGPAHILTYDAAGNQTGSFIAFEGYFGTLQLARGDTNGDGTSDIVAGAGAGGDAHVKVFDGLTGAELSSFLAFDSYEGGIAVASADVTGDGFADIIVGSSGSSSHIKIFSGADGSEIASFFAFPGYEGGVTVASADVNGDGFADIVVGTSTGNSHVKVFSGKDFSEIYSAIAFDGGYTGGVSVAAGDLNGDGYADVVIGARAGGSDVKVFSGLDASELASFTPFPGYNGGVSVSVIDADGSGQLDIGVGTLGSGSTFLAFHFEGLESFEPFSNTFDPEYEGGINVA